MSSEVETSWQYDGAKIATTSLRTGFAMTHLGEMYRMRATDGRPYKCGGGTAGGETPPLRGCIDGAIVGAGLDPPVAVRRSSVEVPSIGLGRVTDPPLQSAYWDGKVKLSIIQCFGINCVKFPFSFTGK